MQDSRKKKHSRDWQRTRLQVESYKCGDGKHTLDDSQAHYLTTVLRGRPGDIVYLFDGAGKEARAKLLETSGGNARVQVLGSSEFEAPDAKTSIHIGQGLTSRSRLDIAVEKMTEAGVASITPLNNFGGGSIDKSGRLAERWKRISSSAAAQCGRFFVPTINEICNLEAWNALLPKVCFKIVLCPDSAQRLSVCLSAADRFSDIAVIAGRKSGLNEQEVKHAQSLGFVSAGLGQRVLRSETVGVVAASVILAHKGEY